MTQPGRFTVGGLCNTFAVPEDQAPLRAVQDVRRDLAENGPPFVRVVGDYECVALPGPDGDALRDLLIRENARVVVEIGLAVHSSLIAERSQLALPCIVAERFVADAAFADGSHSFHNVFVDLFFLREIVRPRGLIVVADCQWPSVATAVRHFEVNAGWRSEAIDERNRLRASRLPEYRGEPTFELFRDFHVDPTG